MYLNCIPGNRQPTLTMTQFDKYPTLGVVADPSDLARFVDSVQSNKGASLYAEDLYDSLQDDQFLEQLKERVPGDPEKLRTVIRSITHLVI